MCENMEKLFKAEQEDGRIVPHNRIKSIGEIIGNGIPSFFCNIIIPLSIIKNKQFPLKSTRFESIFPKD